MLKRRSKHFALLLVLTMLATMFVGVGTASAKSLIATDKVMSIAEDYNSETLGSTVGPVITIQEDSNYLTDFAANATFKISLPSGVKWFTAVAGTAGATTITYGAAATPLVLDTDFFKRTDQVIEIVLPAGACTAGQDKIVITPGIIVSSATGDIALTVDGLDSAISSGSIVFAKVASGKTVCTVGSVKKIGKTGTADTIEVREVAVGSLGNGVGNTLTLKLPSNFEWNGMAVADVAEGGGFPNTAVTAVATGASTRDLVITFTTAARTSRGVLYITPKIKANSEAAKGDISVSFGGTLVGVTGDTATGDLVIATYTDYGTTAAIKEVKDLKSGKFEAKTAKITIEENMTGALIANRDVHVEFPSWVKVDKVNNWSVTNGGAAFNLTAAPTIDGKKSYMDITVAATSTSKGKIEFELALSIQADKSGDIEAKISGAGATEQTLVVGKALARATMETKPTDVKVGLQDQVLSDIIITETVKEGFALSTLNSGAAANDGKLTVTLTDGVVYSTTPKVEVIEGNCEVKDVAYADGVLSMNIKSESTKPSKLKISGIKATLNRSVPEGAIYAKVGGSAINENSKAAIGYFNGANAGGNAATVDAGEFDVATVVKQVIANVVTPAPQETGKMAGTVTFVIGKASFNVNGVDQTMDVAPYIKDSRTYMPIRYVGNALGITDANILWDAAAQTVTLSKNSTFVQVKVGSKTMLVNGMAVTMDVAPEITSSRTMLPISFIANAFGGTAAWDAATQTVTIK